MEKIKQSSIAGMFYPADKEELNKQFEEFTKNDTIMPKESFSTRAVIVPHAGWIYSGKIAYNGLRLLNKNIKNLFIIAPSHKVAFDGLAVSDFEGFETPLGTIEVNLDLQNELKEKFNINHNAKAFESEHSLEVQLPLIQKLFENVKIIPVLVGKEMPEIIENILKTYYPNQENGFIISSDLSHFLNQKEQEQLDLTTAYMVENGETFEFKYAQACGAIGVVGLTNFATENDYSMIRIDMGNSGAITKDTSRVVGYGAWALYEGQRNQFIQENFPEFILNLCKTGIESGFHNNPIEIKYPRALESVGASFVTLEIDNHLRGCIGSVVAKDILIRDIIINAKNAAFADPRFKPVTEEEAKNLQISVSLLSEPKAIVFDTEEELLEQIVPNKDGIIIEENNARAVYLPSVWEQFSDKKDFLNSLKVKAGFEAAYFSKTMRAYKFETNYIK